MGKIGSSKTPVRRLSLWLVAGVAFGLALGFLIGLTKPRPRVV
jgi:hypothetical protein